MPLCQAAQTRSLEVTQQGNRYSTQMQVLMAVAPAAAMRVLQDYAHLSRLNPAVQEARVLSVDGPRTRLQSRIEMCVAFMCKTLHMVQDMQRTAPLSLQASVIPAQSDLEYGQAHWRFQAVPEGTLMRFDAQIEPAFWVPPIIGPWLIRRALEKQATITSRNLERLARASGQH